MIENLFRTRWKTLGFSFIQTPTSQTHAPRYMCMLLSNPIAPCFWHPIAPMPCPWVAATSLHTYQLAHGKLPDTLTPNAKTAILARRWREERNFW